MLTTKNKETSTRVLYNLKVFDMDDNVADVIPVIYCKSDWPFEENDSPKQEDLKAFPEFQNLPFQFVQQSIGLLVGLSVPRIVKPLKIINGSDENSAYVTMHKFGYALNGPIDVKNENNFKCFQVKVEKNRSMEEQFMQLCSQEFKDDYPETFGPSLEDQKWLQIMQKSLKKTEDGHFEVSLPFRERVISLPNNREQVLKRLMSSSRRLKKDPELHNEYKQFMNLMLQSGFSEEVPTSQLRVPTGKTWYLFHFSVRHKQKNKIRIVFDASLKYQGTSLNDTLFQGPDLTSNLLGVLLRFRQGKIAFTADIQKMFYQVRVPEDQRNFLRYLWFPDGDLEKPPQEYRVRVHIFGAVSSPSVANYVLKHTASMEEAKNFSQESLNTITRNFYVDDCLKAVDEENQAIKIVKEVSHIVGLAGLKLTGYVSNSKTMLSSVPTEDLSVELKELNLFSDALPYEKALGVTWDVASDSLGIRLNLPENPCTKRGILSTTSSIYDPLGLAAPALLPAKRIFQLACFENADWNKELSPELQNDWKNWRNNIDVLQEFRIPRCFKDSSNVKDVQLHLFSDGSETAYAAVAYLRFTDVHDKIHCSFVMAKTSLVPMKSSALATIPRIELNGAKLAIRIYKIITNELELNIKTTYFWTDSVTVLKYLHSETNRFQRFVSNRVAYIREHTNVENWRHVPGEFNPADVASRGVCATDFLKCQFWKEGPAFLWKKHKFWPLILAKEKLTEDDPELKKVKIVMVTQTADVDHTWRFLTSSSSWFRTKRNVCWILRLKDGLKSDSWNKNKLNVDNLLHAEEAILKYVQAFHFVQVILLLQQNKLLPKDNALRKLNPFLDENKVLRVGGRIFQANMSYEVRHPIILPKNNYIVELIVRQMHIRLVTLEEKPCFHM